MDLRLQNKEQVSIEHVLYRGMLIHLEGRALLKKQL